LLILSVAKEKLDADQSAKYRSSSRVRIEQEGEKEDVADDDFRTFTKTKEEVQGNL
jgi:hypothetical protein